MPSGFIHNEGKIPIYTSQRQGGATSQTANVGWDRMNTGIRTPPLPSANGLLSKVNVLSPEYSTSNSKEISNLVHHFEQGLRG